MLQRTSLAVLCACLLACPMASAEEAPRNTKPFKRFKVLLGGFLNDTVPFDVPFIIWGDIEPSMTENIPSSEVTLSIGELRSGTSCDVLTLPSFSRTAAVKVKKWTDVDFKDRGIDIPTDLAASTRHQFEMVVPALKPRKIYCFLFQVAPGLPPTAEQAAALAAAVLPAYQNFLRRRGVQKELGDEQSEPLRQELIQAMRAAIPIRNMSPRPGTVFDPNAKPETVAAKFRESWSRVNSQHTRAVTQLERFQRFGAGSRNEEMLANWRKWSAAIGRISNIAPDAAEVQAIGALRDEQIARLIVGLPQDGPEDIITDLWQPDPSIGAGSKTPETDPCPVVPPLSLRCREIERTMARLQRLHAMLSAAHAKMPATATSPDPGEVSQVVNALADTLEDLADRKVNILTTQRAINQRHEEMVRHVKELEALVPTEWLSMTTTHGNLETRKGWYMSADTGLAVGVSINEILPYIGTNIYFWPVNTEAPPGPFRTRFSTLIGFTWTDNILKPGERASLYGNSVSLALGAGWRITEFVKLTGGTLTFKGLDPNPLINNPRLRMTPFVAISGDIDMAKLLGGLFGDDAEPPKTIGAGTTK